MPDLVRFDCYEVDLAAGQIYRHGTRISLQDKSFQVLAALLERPGEVVAREDLRRRLWRDEVFVDFDNNLNTAIARLRYALGDSADHPRFIETLPKRGYRFLERVSGPPRRAVTGQAGRARLVVLPFLNLSGDVAQEYFSDAITDQIIAALAEAAPEQLAVIARTTAMHYKGSRKDVADIGRELAADYVVEGGVHRSGDQVVINVQLIQVSDQSHLYAHTYEAAIQSLFELQHAIAQTIGARLAITPAIDDARCGSAARHVRRPTDDLVAYDAYIRGRHLLFTSPTSIPKAKELFEEATIRDPQFALAYDALGEAHWWIGFLGLASPKEAFSAGVFRALRAVEIDSGLGEAHALLGMFRKELDYNWPEVKREMELALERSPASPLVRFRNAMSWLMAQGRLTEAIAELQCALESDPLDVNVRCWLGIMYWLGRQYDRALEQAWRALEVVPNFPAGHLVVGQTRTMQHRFDEALPALRRAVDLYGGAPVVLGWLGLALAQSGNSIEARALLDRLHATTPHAYVPASGFAWTHLGLGEVDAAFSWMDRAIDERDPMMIPIKTYPFLDPIRDDARFSALLRKMNLDT